MKKKIKPEDFPIEINKENIDILARMKLNYPPPVKFPPPMEWRIIISFLSENDKTLVSNRVREIQIELEKQRWDSLSKEEQEEEKSSIEKNLKEESQVYRGNILQQEWDSINLARIEEEKKKKDREDES